MMEAARPANASNAPEAVAAFVDIWQSNPPEALVANLSTEVHRLDIGGQSFPLTLNDGAPTLYLCHPTTGYIDYALDETRNFAAHPALRAATSALIRAARPIVKAAGLDRQVQLNNWLFSTNPVPALTRDLAAQIRDRLLADHPDHAILLRSLNKMADAETMEALLAAGFRLMPARQIYIFSDLAPDRLETANMRRDRKLLAKTPLTRVGNDGFSEADYPICAQLYAALYLQKYTALNPDYTADYIAALHRAGLIALEGFRDETGRLVAVTGYFESGRTLTQPIVGYDTSRPQSEGLYRLVMQLARDHAAAKGLFFNCSAGAAGFKRHRGGVPVIEYTAVYTRHLPKTRRLAGAVMRGILTRIGIPLLERFRL